MGAEFCEHQLTAHGWDGAGASAVAKQVRDQHEYGHGAYTGHLGTVSGVNAAGRLEFESYEAAREYIQDKHQKWEPPMLVRIKGTNGYLFAGWMPS